jgi:hypothetical protein
LGGGEDEARAPIAALASQLFAGPLFTRHCRRAPGPTAIAAILYRSSVHRKSFLNHCRAIQRLVRSISQHLILNISR